MEKQNGVVSQVSARIKELREILELTEKQVADKINLPIETYIGYESGKIDIPISALYEIANILNVDATVLLTGKDPRMDSVSVCRAGKGVDVERYPGYSFSSLAYNFKHRIMEPLLVTLEDNQKPAKMVTHMGQEFNFVLKGKVRVTINGRDYILNEGDCIYFDPKLPHGQSCVDGMAQFITIILE